MKPTKKPFVVKGIIPIYEQIIFLAVGNDCVEAIAQLPLKYFPEKNDMSLTGMNAGTVADELTNALGILLSYKQLDRECIAHEVRHAEGKLFKLIEQEPLPHDSEVAAYLNDWITSWVYRQLDKRKLVAR